MVHVFVCRENMNKMLQRKTWNCPGNQIGERYTRSSLKVRVSASIDWEEVLALQQEVGRLRGGSREGDLNLGNMLTVHTDDSDNDSTSNYEERGE